MAEENKPIFVINKYSRKRGINGTVLEEESLVVQATTKKDAEAMFDKRWDKND